ncbi:MAG: hypothetical protein U1E42_06395 [Rhodospirillales bacterium]
MFSTRIRAEAALHAARALFDHGLTTAETMVAASWEERRLLQDFKGIGEVGADIFLREVQLAWEEVFPFADRRSLRAAARLGLDASASALAALVEHADVPRLMAALVRVELGKHHDRVLAAATA